MKTNELLKFGESVWSDWCQLVSINVKNSALNIMQDS